MRRNISINSDWKFQIGNSESIDIDLPHTWNNIDGQDGGDDYLRTEALYTKIFDSPEHNLNEDVYLQFDGVNSSCKIYLNECEICSHDGGYSTFRINITDVLSAKGNELKVIADNRANDSVYPQKADFTFYGGIYRDVTLHIMDKNHFDMDYYGGIGLEVVAKPANNYSSAEIVIDSYDVGGSSDVEIQIYDMADNCIFQNVETENFFSEIRTDLSGAEYECRHMAMNIVLTDIHLWEGMKNPYLYRAVARLRRGELVLDEVESRFGIRDFRCDSKRGFYLNGKPYPLHGVSRHQDRRGLGNAVTDDMHLEDMNLICEMGANTIRLAHYQHSRYFYDLCDERGIVVWAEIPYISEHMKNGRKNTISQMRELIAQNINHPSIVCWGVSNEITISGRDPKDMLDNHIELNNLCHELDPGRFTTLACYAMCPPFHPVAHITDTVSWNLYLGWYVPGLFLNDIWMRFFHLIYPDRCLGYSEYGCEGMPNLHSERPRRGDHSEEYQAKYHEYMLKCFERHPFLWATHVWNMFDFAADARNQGGEPGMNHKGLVTFDRKVKKDSFYLYKAWWSDEPFIHIASKRFTDRTKKHIVVKVYTNQDEVALFRDGMLLEKKTGRHVFEFRVYLEAEHEIKAVSGKLVDRAVFRKVINSNPDYTLSDSGDKGANWADK